MFVCFTIISCSSRAALTMHSDIDATGNPTVGYGHLCKQSGCSEIPYPIPLSEADGQKLLQDDIKVGRALPNQLPSTDTDFPFRSLSSASPLTPPPRSSSTRTSTEPWSAGPSMSAAVPLEILLSSAASTTEKMPTPSPARSCLSGTRAMASLLQVLPDAEPLKLTSSRRLPMSVLYLLDAKL